MNTMPVQMTDFGTSAEALATAMAGSATMSDWTLLELAIEVVDDDVLTFLCGERNDVCSRVVRPSAALCASAAAWHRRARAERDMDWSQVLITLSASGEFLALADYGSLR